MKMFITLDVPDSASHDAQSRIADAASYALKNAMRELAATGVVAIPLHVRVASDERYAAMEKAWLSS